MPGWGVAEIKAIIWLRSMAGTEVTVWLKFMRSVTVQLGLSMAVALTGSWHSCGA